MRTSETGVEFEPKVFRKLNYCLGCSRKLEIPKKSFCVECQAKNLSKCQVCECRLEKGLHKHYYYYSGIFDRDEVVARSNKACLIEFLEVSEYDNKHSNTLCKSCKDWQKRIKDVCYMCDNDFKNSREHYKLNGNMCQECLIQFQ